MKNTERRRDVRVVFKTTTQLEFPDAIFKECETHDVSVNGALVAGIKGRKLGDKCKVTVFLRGKSSELQLKMLGEIVRLEKNCIALQFYNVDSDSFSHLKNIVYYNFQHPDETVPSKQCTTPAKPKEKPADELPDGVEDLDLYVNDDYATGLPQYGANANELVEEK
ncbi:MAG: hypothetical protein A2511_16565 [Deltaproteobacteria bacterium RIFOXYD12_FULL_50_9]|nr:MAG: hypothetical protein A2511_16565 [Deltaproteobacteria bacterium RIFOXYD12_FULL_50_9]